MTEKEVRYISPWGNFAIDPDTGLPEVPGEGMFWRVKSGTTGYWRVELRRKVGWYSRVVEWTVSEYEDEALNTNNIIYNAAYCLVKYRNLLEKQKAVDKSLYGDYPPKRLN